jgi:hypothetical protein
MHNILDLTMIIIDVVSGAHLRYNGGKREVVPADTLTLKLKFSQSEYFRVRNDITRLHT